MIIGCGFAGLELAKRLRRSDYQVVVVDKHNYHQFQPLFYQVATAGLEPSSIIFPIRKLLRNYKNVYVRYAEVTGVDTHSKRLTTPLGEMWYDHLVLATGATTNFFGNEQLAQLAVPMKSVSEALYLRNALIEDFEKSITTTDYDERQGLVDTVIVGGGPTGVELAGSLAEMKRYIFPKDYTELDCEEIDIYLVQSGPVLLKGMSAEASAAALRYLQEMGVTVLLDSRVTDYDGKYAHIKDGTRIRTDKLIWAAGITGNTIEGLPEQAVTYGNRLAVDRYHRVTGMEQVYAVGDLAYMETEAFPQGHPQVAPVAQQAARHLADNFRKRARQKSLTAFEYNDKGSMATIGRNRAVVDLPQYKFQGFFAWVVWLVVHLFSIVGIKNRLFVFINWMWNYFTYDQYLRVIIKPFRREA